MIVVSANWLISDGSLCPPPCGSRIATFLRAIERLACRSGMLPDGSYRPIDRVDLVLAGDTFDGLTSRFWLGRIRPWQSERVTRDTIDRIALRCAHAGRRSIQSLRRIVGKGLAVPATDHRHRPLLTRSTRVPVSLTLVAGDRDGLLGRSTASRDVAGTGVAIASSWERTMPSGETVVVRHGHEFDPLCFGGDDRSEPAAREQARRFGRQPTLAESLSIDLLASYAWGLAGVGVPAPVRFDVVRAIARSPRMDVPRVLVGRLGGGDLPPSLVAVVSDAWRRSVDRWHETALAEPPVAHDGVDAVGAVAAWMASIDGLENSGGSAAASRAAERWLDMRSLGLPSGGTRADRSVRVVLGHPPADLSRPVAGHRSPGFGPRVIAIGSSPPPHGVGRAACSPFGPATVTEVGPGWCDGADEPAWLAVSDGCVTIASSDLRRDAA